MESTGIIICCAANRSYYDYAAVTLYSCIKNIKNLEKIYCVIEDDEIPLVKHIKIQYININKLDNFLLESSPNFSTGYSLFSYIRCYLTDFIEYDKVLYIDTDTIVLKDLQNLWDSKVNLLNGCVEPLKKESEKLGLVEYYNSGVLLMNLKECREFHLKNKLQNFLNTQKFIFPDQDAINLSCKDRINKIDCAFNYTPFTHPAYNYNIDDIYILHFAYQKPWKVECKFDDIWYKYEKEAEKFWQAQENIK